MDRLTDLHSALLDLLHETRGASLDLIIGGGFGIFLRYEAVTGSGVRTLLHALPEPRSTNDLDLFLRAELLADPQRVEALSAALARLGYRALDSAKYYQFEKEGAGGGRAGGIKVDLLTGPRSAFAALGLRADERRVHPRAPVHLHAHPVDEALALREHLQMVSIEGTLSSGEGYAGNVFLPNSFTYVLMKLFAFRDSMGDAARDYGRHHALDIYAIVGLMSEGDWSAARELAREHRNDEMAVAAGRIVAEHFGTRLSMGILRLKENSYYRPNFQIPEFIGALKELFEFER